MIVAVDGPAGAGKSTISRMVADRFGWTYLDTGAMYRAVTLLALEQDVAPADGEELGRLARQLQLEFKPGPGGVPRVFAGEREITEDIRSQEVTRNVSEVCAHASVRETMTSRQRQAADSGSVVVDGRDIGTVVFPGAEVKIFLTASVGERARRRRLELAGKGITVTQEAMADDITARDVHDSSREVAPLQAADDALVLDTTQMSIDEVVDMVARIIDEKN
ncbi:MAG: (d)CMP kinase [Thermoleophilia bacterium]